MAEFDLSTRIASKLDRHLVFPLLEFLSVNKIYNEDDILKGKLELLKNTKMVDFAMDVHKKLYPEMEVPESFRDKRTEVVSELKNFREKCTPVVEVFSSDEDFMKLLQDHRDGRYLFDYLSRKHNIQPDTLDALYDYAKFQYECGNYSGAAEYLHFFRVLSPNANDQKGESALWGKLASEILMQNWDVALEDLHRLREVIDTNTTLNVVEQLQQRTWLIHWSLFVYFNHPKGKDDLIELFLYAPQYVNAIQTQCPYILRYVAAAVVINPTKIRRGVFKDLIKFIQQESGAYKDPITEFLEHIYVNFDFDNAQQMLRECETVISNDIFLVSSLDDFIESARRLIFETFCRIHHRISISMLAEKLNMTQDAAERWIVDLIRTALLDAKIDLKEGHVIMGVQMPSVYEQIIEKTKSLTFKTQYLMQNIEKKTNMQKSGREGNVSFCI
ncbi:uncharacterized protein TRIADDRAFT_50473 [Trichoplax adhaerens]|uniref:Eukaryotic translation initiation factor 3 subunit E n=1 Tax=Trichoplax adhaerens TaxID=10228 RepID=B3S263_TRIAD|nr:hypothetical protein TRIADDRAFT_50473 [Trichoplax adhaerens]EDV23058.1 hypothetical protein TRIADDRAFT_50473 [Trichoplax adhaerens]|eukprot:XP_002113968.1 hypothetical protein TRIADDRAFT_50473 [Trichoplax adhaerens]